MIERKIRLGKCVARAGKKSGVGPAFFLSFSRAFKLLEGFRKNHLYSGARAQGLRAPLRKP